MAGVHLELSKLSTEDKLEIIEALWRSIAPEELQAMSFAQAQLEELEGRWQRLQADPASGVSLVDLDEFMNRS